VLRIRFREGPQTVEGTQSYKAVDEPWEPIPFSVVGEFEDDRFTTFAGVWTEGGRSFRVEIFGLPGGTKRVARRIGSSRTRASVKRKKAK
jgi:hypothetical protein